MRQNDIDLYMDMAKRVAQRSYAKRLNVGSVLVNADGVLAIGYNGTPPGWDNGCEVSGEDKTKPEVIHSEMNSLFKFVNSGLTTKNTVMFQTHAPCLDCAKAIFLAGVQQVYYGLVYRSPDGVDFLEKAGVEVIKVD